MTRFDAHRHFTRPVNGGRRTVARIVVLVLTAVGLSAAPAFVAPASAAPVTVTPVRTIGQSGHAGLYGWGMATETDGTILVGDYWNFRIRRYAADGTFLGDVVTAANKGSANNEDIAPELHQSPYGIAVDATNGDFYFGDVDGSATVDKYDKNGNFLFAFGGRGAGVAGKFRYPSRVTVGADRRVYVADQWDHYISVHNPDTGAELFSFGGNGSGNGQFKQPRGLAFGPDGLLYVADNYNRRIEVFDAEGHYLRKFGNTSLNSGPFAPNADLRGLAIDQVHGWVYVSDTATSLISKFTLSGTLIAQFGGFGAADGKFVAGARELTIDADGNLWAGDMPNFRAQKLDSDGRFLLAVPSPADPPLAGGFNQPRGVGVDAAGNVFVSDTHNWRIEKFAPDGTFLKQWGHRGGGEEGFNYARGLDVDLRNGDVVAADTDNHKITKYDNNGNFKWEVGGLGTALNQLQNPHSLAIGPDGRIYVADTQNGRVVVMDENGTALYTVGSKGRGAGQFQFDRSVTLDPTDDSLWVSDSILGIVQHFTNGGTYLGKLGAPGSADNQLLRAADVEVYGRNVYVADVDTHRIKVWDKDGTFVKAFGGGGRQLGAMYNPHGMDVTADGHLYVTEQTGERISVFALSDVDSSAPDTTLTAPATGTTVPAGSVSITGTATDNAAVTGVNLTIRDEASGLWWNGASWSSGSVNLPAPLSASGQAGTAWSFSFAVPFAGSFTVTATARDSANLVDGTPATSTFTSPQGVVDTAAPDGTITVPSKGQVFAAGPVTFSGPAADNAGVTGVGVGIQNAATKKWWNGTAFGTPQVWLTGAVLNAPGAPLTNWSYTWSPPADAAYTLTVRAQDAAGNVDATRPFVNFTASVPVDSTAPETAVTSPADGTSVAAGSIALAGTATDAVGVTGVRLQVWDTQANLYWTGSAWSPTQQSYDAAKAGSATSATWSNSVSVLAPTVIQVQATGRDAAGNIDGSPATSTFSVTGTAADTLAPDGTVTTPTVNQVFPAGPVTFAGTATDNLGVSAVRVGIQDRVGKKWWNGTTWVTAFTLPYAATLTTSGSTATWSQTWTPPSTGSGTYSLTVRAEDAAGNLDPTRPFVNFSAS